MLKSDSKCAIWSVSQGNFLMRTSGNSATAGTLAGPNPRYVYPLICLWQAFNSLTVFKSIVARSCNVSLCEKQGVLSLGAASVLSNYSREKTSLTTHSYPGIIVQSIKVLCMQAFILTRLLPPFHRSFPPRAVTSVSHVA